MELTPLLVLCSAAAVALSVLVLNVVRVRRVRSSTYPKALLTPWVEHLDVVASGCKVHGIRAQGSGAEGSAKPLLLMLHGFPESSWSYRSFLRAFQRDFHAVAVDMPGYGATGALEDPGSWWRPEEHGLARVVETIRGVVEALGYTSCVLVGHDWGGMVAWHVAMAHPGMVDKLVVMSAPHPAAFALNLSLAQLAKSYYIALFQLPVLPEWFVTRDGGALVKRVIGGKRLGVAGSGPPSAYTPDAEDLEAAAWSVSRNPTAAVNYYRSLARVRGPGGGRGGAKLPMPVLLLWGSRDAFLGPELMDGTEEYVASVTKHVFQGASHWLQQDPVSAEGVLLRTASFLGVSCDTQAAGGRIAGWTGRGERAATEPVCVTDLHARCAAALLRPARGARSRSATEDWRPGAPWAHA